MLTLWPAEHLVAPIGESSVAQCVEWPWLNTQIKLNSSAPSDVCVGLFCVCHLLYLIFKSSYMFTVCELENDPWMISVTYIKTNVIKCCFRIPWSVYLRLRLLHKYLLLLLQTTTRQELIGNDIYCSDFWRDDVNFKNILSGC